MKETPKEDKKPYRFAYTETTYGYIEVLASNLEEAKKELDNGNWNDQFTNKNDLEIGELID